MTLFATTDYGTGAMAFYMLFLFFLVVFFLIGIGVGLGICWFRSSWRITPDSKPVAVRQKAHRLPSQASA